MEIEYDGKKYDADGYIYVYPIYNGRKDRRKGITRWTTMSWYMGGDHRETHIRANYIELLSFRFMSSMKTTYNAANTAIAIQIVKGIIIAVVSGSILYWMFG